MATIRRAYPDLIHALATDEDNSVGAGALYARMTEFSFIGFMLLLSDVLPHLSALSRRFQMEEVSINPDIYLSIYPSIRSHLLTDISCRLIFRLYLLTFNLRSIRLSHMRRLQASTSLLSMRLFVGCRTVECLWMTARGSVSISKPADKSIWRQSETVLAAAFLRAMCCPALPTCFDQPRTRTRTN